MDQEMRQRIARAVVAGGFDDGQAVQEAVERALEVLPQPLGHRVSAQDDATWIELVVATRLLTAKVTVEAEGRVTVAVKARVLDDATVAVSMTQRGKLEHQRTWTFQFAAGDTVTVDSRRGDEGFARALASCLGWAEPAGQA